MATRLVEFLVQLVADAIVRRERRALGALLLADSGLGLVVGGVAASFLSTSTAMSLCELQRVAGMRWLENDEAGGVLLGGDHDERAPVEARRQSWRRR